MEPANGAVDAAIRLSNDDFGVFSQTFQIEWRQEIGDKFNVVPFFRFYHQNEADFFMRSLDGAPVATPAANPDGSPPNYSADYRLSSFNAISGGVRLYYQFTNALTASAAYERYAMSGTGGAAGRSQNEAYIDADIWTFGFSTEF